MTDIHEDDAELVRRAVEYVGAGDHVRVPRWSKVASMFGLGSTSAWRLCERLGFDPDEQRGGCDVCGYGYGVVDGERVCACNDDDDSDREGGGLEMTSTDYQDAVYRQLLLLNGYSFNPEAGRIPQGPRDRFERMTGKYRQEIDEWQALDVPASAAASRIMQREQDEWREDRRIEQRMPW